MEKPWNIEISDVQMPEPKEGEALLRVKSAGICGSDIGAFRGTNGLVSYPRIIGHEIAGEVISIPENNKNGIKPGDRVIVDPYLYCGHCYPCSIGRTNCCVDLKVLGVHVDGGMAEYFCHPADMLLKVPDDMPWDIIPLAEPLTIALHGIHRLNLKAGEHIAINGAGPIGLLAAMVALHYGAEPIMIDLVKERLDFAKSLGVQYTINLDIVSHAGRIALTGWPKQETPIPTDMITRKEVDVRGARTSAGEFPEAIDLIYHQKVDARRILTKVISIDEAPETIRDIEKNPGDYMKVNILF